MAAASELQSLVARVDEDRWLTARLAPPAVCSRLVAIYAVNHEIARAAETAREPNLGLMRQLWWREAIEEIAAGKTPRAHPAAQALAEAHRERALPLEVFYALVAARAHDFEPFATWDALEAYVDATAGGVMKLALAACGDAPDADDFIRAGGRAWGFAGLLRVAPLLRPQGRLLPEESDAELAARARAGLADARRLAPRAAALFPAFAYLALVPSYLRKVGVAPPSRFARRLRLFGAALTGRV